MSAPTKGWQDFYVRTLSEIIAQTIEKLNVDIVAQTLENLKVDIAAQTLQQLNVYIAGQQNPINVNISGQDSDINVYIKGQETALQIQGDVNITNSQLDVNVTNSSLNVNVGNQVDINIAQASVSLNVENRDYVEQRRVLQNNASTYDGTTYYPTRGKFFSNNCRGLIESVEIYVKNTDSSNSHDLYVYLSIYPGAPPIYSFIINVDAGFEGWLEIPVKKFWSYETLFVWWKFSSSYLQNAWDNGTPYDSYYSTDGGTTWVKYNSRHWAKVNLLASNNAIPVSGTVNTINIPSSSTGVAKGYTTVSAKDTVTMISVEGTGKVLWMRLATYGSGAQNAPWQIYIDDELVFSNSVTYHVAYFQDVGAGLGVRVTKYDTSNNRYTFMITLPLEFRRKLEVKIYNPNDNSIAAEARVIYTKLT